MFLNKLFKSVSVAALAGVLAFSTVAPAFAADTSAPAADVSTSVTDMAAAGDTSTADSSTTVTATTDREAGTTPVTSATIDASKTGSLSIHKYDLTAAQEAGIDVNSYVSTGAADTAAQTALSKYALQGVVFTYLKVGGIGTFRSDTSTGASTTTSYALPDELAALIGLDAGTAYTSSQLNAALASYVSDSTNAKNTLESWITANGGVEMEETDAYGNAEATGMELGLYLVVETKVPQKVTTTTTPFFVSVPMTSADGSEWDYSVVVYPKNQTDDPAIDKLVKDPSIGSYSDTATLSEGDTANYLITSEIPDITSTSTYLTEYTFEDVLPDGQTYVDDVYIVFYDNETDAKENNTSKAVATWEHSQNDTLFTVTYSEGDNGSVMIVKPTDAGLKEINQKYGGYYMAIVYDATVESNSDVVLGDAGNTSPVTLTYTRTNTNYHQSLEDKVVIYTYGLDIIKKFSDDAGDMSNVNFTVQNKTDNYYVVATGSNGTYYASGKTTTEANATAFVPNTSGALHIYGLEADTYTLTETKTDTGYALLSAPITILVNKTLSQVIPSVAAVTGSESTQAESAVTVTSAANAAVDGTTVSMASNNDSANATVSLNITNARSDVETPSTATPGDGSDTPDKSDDGDSSSDSNDGGSGSGNSGVTLPQTGGAGKVIISVVAIAIVGGGSYLIYKGKKADGEEDSSEGTEE